MCLKLCGRRRKPPTLMMIRRVSGARYGLLKIRRRLLRKRREPRRMSRRLQTTTSEHVWRASSAAGENRGQLLGGNHFELRISAVARLLIHAPPPEMRHVPEAKALHVLVSDLGHQFRPQGFP